MKFKSNLRFKYQILNISTRLQLLYFGRDTNLQFFKILINFNVICKTMINVHF